MVVGDLGTSVFTIALAVGVYLILKPLFGFLERAAESSAHFSPWLVSGIAAAIFAIAAVYVVGAPLLYLHCNLTVQAHRAPFPWWFQLALAPILLAAGGLLLLLIFRVVFVLQQHGGDDGRQAASAKQK